MIVKERLRHCKYCGDLHDVRRVPDNCKEQPWPRSDYPSPYVQSDYLPGGINGLMHHGVGRRIDNKAGYRRATKESGCIEVGNEYVATTTRTMVDLPDKVIESGVNEALHQLGISSESDMGKLDYGDG